MQLDHTIKPTGTATILGLIALFLTIQSFFTEYLLETYVGSGSDSLLALILDLFSANLEESIPTWYSTIILIIAAAILAVIALQKRNDQDRYSRHWAGLSALFVYFSMDEGAVIHEIFADPLQQMFDTSGFLAFGWQILAAPLVVIFALLYLRFLLHLPAKTRGLFALAAITYVGGALVVEGISANQWDLDGGISLTYLGIATLEECFEMLGVVVFIYALLAYVANQRISLRLLPEAGGLLDAHGQSGTTATNPTDRPFTARHGRRLIAIAITILLVNSLLFWIASRQEKVEDSDSYLLQAIVNTLSDKGVLIAHMPESFGPSTANSARGLAAILDVYNDVLVLSLPANNSTLVFAADALPFDQGSLTDILHDYGESQFVIFDSSTARLLIGDRQSQP